MTGFLANIRRFFGWGAVFYLLCEYWLRIDFTSHSIVQAFYALFFIFSPIVFLILLLVSVAYYRKHEQFDAIHQDQKPIASFFICLGYDLATPFMIIVGFVKALINKNVEDRGLLIARFIGMLVIVVICGIGLISFCFTT